MPRNRTEIVLPGKGIFPESITSTSDGTLIVGSLGHGNVSRIAPGKTAAEEWIKPGTGGLNGVLGVFADEKGKNLWVCSNNLENKGEATSVKAFDLKTGALKGTYPLPGDGAAVQRYRDGRRWHGLYHRHPARQRLDAQARRQESGTGG